MKDDRRTAMLWGAFVADAAAMGLHWLYDQERLAAVAGDRPEFHAPDPAAYAGTEGYFAHPMKRPGDLSHYGEQLRAMLEGLAANGSRYAKPAYEAAFVARFGYGGSFHGYIDKPTRGTLDNLARVDPEDAAARETFHGADDTQIPALAKLPALAAAHHGARGLDRLVASAVRVTNDNPTAVAYGKVAGRMLEAALDGGTMAAVIDAGKAAAKGPIAALLAKALDLAEEDNAAATRHFGLHCGLDAAFPSLVHNLATAPDYRTAVRRNILAGGDSCGRAILLGALAGAVRGIGRGKGGVPKSWIDRLSDKAELAELIATVLTRGAAKAA